MTFIPDSDPSLPTGTVSAPAFSEAPLVAQFGHLGLLADAQIDQSIDRLVDLLISGAIVTVRPGERVRVLEDALTAVRVETLDGSGRSGWAPSAWLRLDHSFSAPVGRGAA